MALFVLALAGTLFAGYLTFTKMVLGQCALNETCPYFFGYPACLFGFIIYATLLFLTFNFTFLKKSDSIWMVNLVSGFGVIYAVYFSYIDLTTPCPLGTCSYSLLLPSCVWGLAMFVLIFGLSWHLVQKIKSKKRFNASTTPCAKKKAHNNAKQNYCGASGSFKTRILGYFKKTNN